MFVLSPTCFFLKNWSRRRRWWAIPCCSYCRSTVRFAFETCSVKCNLIFSVNNRLETTSLPNREARAADAQYFLNPRSYYANQLRDIQSAFYSSAYDPLPLSFRDSYALPAADQRQLFSELLTATTMVSAMLKMNMVTRTPRCSRAGPIPQCANA